LRHSVLLPVREERGIFHPRLKGVGMRADLARVRAEFRGPRALAVWAGLTMLLTVGGPLGTLQSADFEQRMLFWAAIVICMISLSSLATDVMGRLMGEEPRKRDLIVAAAVVALVLTVPISAFAAGHSGFSVGIVTSHIGETMAFLFLTALALTSIRHLDLSPRADVLPQPAGEAPEIPRVIARLEPHLQGRLLSLTGRDHYVDVRTTAGMTTILMRFSDAMAEVAPVEGAQIHRSHWVAWAAIDGIEREGGKLVVVTGDEKLPVSRSYRYALAERGLL
jgi:DNA-binding LytR/AlgR family response regulator